MFHYQNDHLHCEAVSLARIKEEVGSPTYIYSASIIEKNIESYQSADPDALFAYALKANQNLEILKLIQRKGLGADVTSGGELFLALQAGFDPQKIIYSGVGKRDDEIRMALASGISAIHVESAAECDVIEAIAAELNLCARVGFRLNPNVNAETHPYISTGLHENKFGVPLEVGVKLLQRAAESPYLTPVGIAMHIGSQIRETSSFIEAAGLVTDIAIEMRSSGMELDYVDIGGGLGINYESALPDNQDAHRSINQWVHEVGEPVRSAGFRVKAEPGRSIVGSAGALLAEVTFCKSNGAKRFVITDAGMNDLLRPPLYSAHHPILPVNQSHSDATGQVDIVGPICESSDFLGKGVELGFLQRGDLLAVMHTGAYGFAMSSNYNGRLRPAEVLVTGNSWRVIRSRESYSDLI